jgi:hypothetical protein
MSQIVLPLAAGGAAGPSRIVIGNANAAVLDAFEHTAAWPFRTAILFGPPRSGKSVLARWFAESGAGEVVDDAETMDETALFHRWNRAQEHANPLLMVSNGSEEAWNIALPDLASRVGAALHLTISPPNDAMLADLIAIHAEQRGLVLGEGAAPYLIPRCTRSFAGIEALVTVIDRLSLERKAPATQVIWRDALEEIVGAEQPRLI